MDWDKLKVGQVWETNSVLPWMLVVRIEGIYEDEIALDCFGQDYREWVEKDDLPNFVKLLMDAE